MLRSENKKLDQNYENMKEEYRELRRQLEEAEKDVQRLLIKRESIQNIQRILIDLTKGPTTASQINSAIQEIKDILGNTQSRRPQPTGYQHSSTKQGTDVPLWYKKLVEKKKA